MMKANTAALLAVSAIATIDSSLTLKDIKSSSTEGSTVECGVRWVARTTVGVNLDGGTDYNGVLTKTQTCTMSQELGSDDYIEYYNCYTDGKCDYWKWGQNDLVYINKATRPTEFPTKAQRDDLKELFEVDGIS